MFSGRYRTYRPVLLMTSPARGTPRVGQPDFRFFVFCGSYGDFRSLRTIREAGLWAMRRLKCPGHSDCAQIATWWPPDDAMASVPREVPRDRGTRVHTPSHCPGASFGRPPQGGGLEVLKRREQARNSNVENAVSGILRLQVRDLSTHGQYATPEAASPARVGQVPTSPGLQLTASAAEPFEQQTRRREPRKKVTSCLQPNRRDPALPSKPSGKQSSNTSESRPNCANASPLYTRICHRSVRCACHLRCCLTEGASSGKGPRGATRNSPRH